MKRATLIAVAAMAAAIVPTVGQAESVPCTDTGAPSWGRYGLNEQSTRHQTDTSITAGNAETLAKAWSIPSSAIEGGSFMSTPLIYNGCVIVATDLGRLGVFDQSDGALIWSTNVAAGSGPAGTGGYTVGAPAVSGRTIYVTVSENGSPRVAAVNLDNGEVLWDVDVSPVGDTQAGLHQNAAPVVAGDVIFMGIAGFEGDADARGGYAILDKVTGAILESTYTINDIDYATGYRGASVWSTAAYDAESGMVFVGAGNPASKNLEHRYSNAVLKIDVDPDSGTFGDIVDAYKGTTDQYYAGLDRQPACDLNPDVAYLYWSATCAQLDLDFGASPNLFHDARGNLMVSILQKSGVFHTIYADNMSSAWTQIAGAPCAACNLSSSAIDDEYVFAAGTPGHVTAMSQRDGRIVWTNAIGDGAHLQSLSVANDLVVTTTLHGMIMGWDAKTGLNAFTRSAYVEVGTTSAGLQSGGVAIAGTDMLVTVGTGSGAQLILFRLPESL